MSRAKGIPVAIDREKMDGINLVGKSNESAGNHGAERIGQRERRMVRISSRENSEATAATVA